MGFLGGSDGKESTCNAGDLGLVPGLARSPEGGHGNSGTSQVALVVKTCLPMSMQEIEETQFPSLGREDPKESALFCMSLISFNMLKICSEIFKGSVVPFS